MFDLASFSQEIRSCYGLQLRVCVCVWRYLEEIFSVQSLISALACGSYHIFLKQLEHSSDHRFGPNGKEIKAIASPFIRACVCVQSEDFFTNKVLSPMRFNLPHISGAAKTKSILLTFSMLDKKWKGHQSQSYLHICSSLHAIAWCPITIVVWIWPWICPWVCPWIAPGLKSFNQSVYANHLKSICSMNT